MVYGNTEAVSGGPPAGAIFDRDVDVNGNALNGAFRFAQPAKPDPNQRVHSGYLREETTLEPPVNGNFWFPDYYKGKVVFAQFVICDNNNHPFNGCDSGSQSIGVWDIASRTYQRLNLHNKAFAATPIAGSISDIRVEQSTGRIYYLGRPNYIGYVDLVDPTNPALGWAVDDPAKNKILSLADVCGNATCGVGNEMALLASGDVAVTDRNLHKLRIFKRTLTPWPGGQISINVDTPDYFDPTTNPNGNLLPLSIASSPVCAGLAQPGNPSCYRSRFVINFDTRDSGQKYFETPIAEYVFDRDSPALSQVGRPVVPKTNAWVQGDKKGNGASLSVDGGFRGIRYNKEGTLWVATFDPVIEFNSDGSLRRSQYNPAEVFAYHPRRDASGNGNDTYPWHPGETGRGCDATTTKSNGAQLALCDRTSAATFASSGGFVDSIVEAGSDMYWAGWGGRFDGLIRTNPGAWPPAFSQDPVWPTQSRLPNTCFNPTDAYLPVSCSLGLGAINVPGTAAARVPAAFERPSDQLTHLVYDPDRGAVWATLQSALINSPFTSQGTSTTPADNIVLPQWLLRHNLRKTGPFIDQPTGSVAGNLGQSLNVGARVYSNVSLEQAEIIYTDENGVVQPAVSVPPTAMGAGLYRIGGTVTSPSDPAKVARYRFRVVSTAIDPGTGLPFEASTPDFDVVPVVTTAQHFHYAEGYFDANWRNYMTIVNPPGADANVTITYRPDRDQTPGGQPMTPFVQNLVVSANSRKTVSAYDVLLAAGWPSQTGFGISVDSDVAVVSERPTYFTASAGLGTVVDGAHNVMGIPSPQTSWNFAEGYFASRPGIDDWQVYVVLSNPSASDAQVNLKLLPDPSMAAEPAALSCTVRAGKRTTVPITQLLKGSAPAANCSGNPWSGVFGNPASFDQGRGVGFGIEAVSTNGVPVVAERPIYYDAQPGISSRIKGGDAVLGTPQGRTRWILAEGVADPNFATYLTVANPANQARTYDVTLFTAGVQPVRTTQTVGARARATFGVHDFLRQNFNLPGGHADVAIEVRSDGDLVVERPIYFNGGAGVSTGSVSGGHHTVGTTLARTEWRFAEGFKGSGSAEYLTLLNPGDVPAQVNVTYVGERQNGNGPPPTSTRSYTVAAGQRDTVVVNNSGTNEIPSFGADTGFGMIVTSTNGVPIVAERPMYWNRNIGGFAISGGHNVLPLHAQALGSAQMVRTPYLVPAFPEASLSIDRITADLTATVGQQLVFDASMSGDSADSAELVFNNGSTVSHHAMTQVSPGRWRVALAATAPGGFEVVAQRGITTQVSDQHQVAIVQQAITGRVTAADGSPLAATPVNAARVNAIGVAVAEASVLTNEDGYYWAPVPEPGEWALQIIPQNAPGQVPGLADMYSVHTTSSSESTRITVPIAGASYDESLPLAGRIVGQITASDTGQPLTNVSVGFFRADDHSKLVGSTVFTDSSGRYEKWLPPGEYVGLVNSAIAAYPLGWNGYAPMWSKAELFQAPGQLDVISVPATTSTTTYDEQLLPTRLVTGRVVPQGGPGLGDASRVGGLEASLGDRQFWSIPLPQNGEFVYPLPDGDWKFIFVIPGYEQSYYHDTTESTSAQVVTVEGAGVALLDQHVNPVP